MLRNVVRKMGRYLVAISSKPTAPARNPSGQAQASTKSQQQFERNARELLKVRKKANKPILSGSIQLLGMDEIKQTVGENWSAVADLAYQIAEDTIQKHLSAHDVFQRHGNDDFILCFSTANKAQAERKTREIVDEIGEALARQVPKASLQVGHFVTELDWATVENSDGMIVDAIAEALTKVRAEAEIAAQVWRQQLLEKATIRFSPIWHPQSLIVGIYRVLLDEETGRYTLQRFEAISSTEDLKLAVFELDCLLIGRAVQALHSLLSENGKAQFIIPVNFSTLNDRSNRAKYIKLCADIPQSYKKFILFQLHGAAAGTPASRIIEIGLALREHGRGVLVETSLAPARVTELAATGLLGVSVDAKTLPTKLASAIQKLSRFVKVARATGLKVYIHDADTMGFVEAAADAQVDYVDGPGVALTMNEPKNAFRWNPRLT